MIRRMRKWWKREYNHKYVNGGKGVISIMLCILLLPFSTFAAALIETGRYHSAVSVLDQSMNNAAVSTLSNYDTYLRARFGLNATKQENQKDIYLDYLEKNVSSMQAIDLSGSNLEFSGKYSLNDTDILRGQVLEASKFSVPTAITGDFVVSELITLLEKMTHLTNIFKVVSSASGLTDSLLTVAEDMEKLKDLAKTLESNIQEYKNKYGEFKKELNKLKEQIKDVGNKKNEYDAALAESGETGDNIVNLKSENEQLKEQLDVLKKQDKTESVKEKIENINNQISDNKEKIEQLEKQLKKENNNVNKANDEYEKAQKKLEDQINKMQKEINNYQKAVSDVRTTLDSYQNKANTIMGDLANTATKTTDMASSITAIAADDEYDTKDLDKQKKNLEEKKELAKDDEEKNKIQTQIDGIKGQINDANAAKTNEQEKAKEAKNGMESVQNLLKDGMKDYKSNEVSDAITALDNIYVRLAEFDVKGVTEETTIKESDYYYEITGFISSSVLSSTIEKATEELDGSKGIIKTLKAIISVLENVFKVTSIYDGRLDAYITNIDQYEPGDIDLILGDIGDILNIFSTDDGGREGLLKALFYLSTILEKMNNLGNHLGNYLKGIVARTKNVVSEIFSDKIGEKLLIDGYLVYSLSNRTNVSNSAISGKNILTGYSFSNVEYQTMGMFAAPLGIFDVIKLLKEIQVGGNAEMFCGAELEYILTGTRSEIINQTVVFFQLYFMRMIVDIIPILGNREVETIVGSVPAVLKIVIIIAYFLIEPYLDTLIIVNGGKQSLLKKVVYITPSGLLSLINKFTTIGINQGARDNIKENAKGLFDDDISTNIQDDGLVWDYGNYMLVLMFVTGDSETFLKRFKSIIAMESKQHYKKDFNLSNSYTYIDAKIRMKYKSFLGKAGLAANGIYSINREQMRGY